ncbi:MAG: hypothetical protein HY840_11915 [Bacteroidetes bacterium]|nr:hypothetical protein [Bacteroidota bacterium]
MKTKQHLFTVLIFLISVPLFAQDGNAKPDSTKQAPHGHGNADPKHSVYGPPMPAKWKFQLAYDYRQEEGTPAFNFYKKNQRDRTLFFTIRDNSYDNINQYRVQRIAAGAALFPIKNDDRFQFDLGGVLDKIIDSTLYNKTLYSRLTWRATKKLWLRAGFEYSDEYKYYENHLGVGVYTKSLLSSYYFSAKYKIGFFTPIAVVGNGTKDTTTNTRYGAGAMLNGPKGTFLFGGYIKSTDETEDTRTLAIGRSANFGPDAFPSSIYVWKHKNDYDFHLGALFFGKTRNRLVKPATDGMTNGMFISTITLRENSLLRQRQFLTITDDFENGEYSIFFIHMNVKIPMGPSTVVNAGFSSLQFFKLFTNTKFWIFSEPVIGLFYNEETTPEFNLTTMKMGDKTERFFSFQVGSKIKNKFMFHIISEPTRSGIIGAVSYLIN